MNQSDRTLAYHFNELSMAAHLGHVWKILTSPQAPVVNMGGVGGTRQREYDPNQQAERVELRCPICHRLNCPLDVRRGM